GAVDLVDRDRVVEQFGDVGQGLGDALHLVRSGRTKRWRPELLEMERVAESLADIPELLYDTISVNKIYRTSLLVGSGIRFPEGLLFEDQLFTLEVMATAGRVAVIPQTVYRWYVDRLSEEPSITQRRNEARNVDSRIEVNRRIDAFLERLGDPRLTAAKQVKFLRHDLYLYLSSMLEIDDETAMVLVDRLVPYVATLDPRPAWEVRPALRVAIYHLLQRDLEGIRSAMRFVKWASVVDVRIRADGGRQWWGCEHLDGGPDAGGIGVREWLDVTTLGIDAIPFSQRRYLHRVESFVTAGDRVVVTGSTVDQDGELVRAEGVELRFLIGGSRTLLSLPGAWTGWEGVRRMWRAEGTLLPHPARDLEERDRGTVALAIVRDDIVNVTGLRSAEADVPSVGLGYPGRVRTTGPDSLVIGAHENGAVGWKAVTRTSRHRRAAARRRRWYRLPGATRLATVLSLVRRDWLTALAGRLARAMPARAEILVDPGTGRPPQADVAAVAHAVRHLSPDLAQVWVARPDRTGVPPTAQCVDRGSIGHAWHAGRAFVRIEDGATAPALPQGRGRVVVNARVTTPVHRIGLDDPSVLTSRSSVAAHRRRGRSWSVLAASSADAADVIAPALAFSGRIDTVGLPRMDTALRHLAAPDGRAALREVLDLPADRAVIVHIPADRDIEAPLLDLEDWAAALGRHTYLVLAAGVGESVPTARRHAVRLLAPEEDLSAHIAASDLVVSDYSDRLADAAAADRAIVLFQPDREEYARRTRGLYAGVDDLGPVVTTQLQLGDVVTDWLRDPMTWDAAHGPARRAWAARYCGPVDGHAGRRLAEAVLP
ncbi:MAG: CDP-glycerol glycerophosphotransferase family protein, partial [Actinomycetes bacterium]